MTERIVDVAVIGLGPVGAVLGNMLGAAGLHVAIYEREADIVPIPRAVALDGEIMRVVQSIGLAETLEPHLRVSTGGQFVDPQGRAMLTRAPSDEEGRQGWRNFYNFHQPVLEIVLREGLKRFPNVAVHLRHDVYALEETPHNVRLRVEDMANGALMTVVARYVVGCDGARSLVRRLIGSRLDDLGLHEPWVVADFELTGPAPALPPITTQYCDPVAPVTYVQVVENRRRWEFKLSPDADLKTAAMSDNVWRMVQPWVTPANARLTRSALYMFHSLIAERWRRDRLVIAGDAAHQTPPFMGQGLCAGIRDAANLAWKLARVLRLGAPDALLDTYGSERTVHTHAFIDMAVKLGIMLNARNSEEMHALSARIGTGGGLVHPTPRLGAGLHEDSPAGGVVAPQPRLGDGGRLDERLGAGLAVIGTPGAMRALGESARAAMAALGAVTVEASGDVATWLETMGRSFAVLRPDRYVFATATDGAELGQALERLSLALGVQGLSPS